MLKYSMICSIYKQTSMTGFHFWILVADAYLVFAMLL